MKHLGFGGHGLVLHIRIVLVFDGFINYHFEPCQNMKNSLFVFGFQCFQCPKNWSSTRQRKSHLYVEEIPNSKH
jgi:hypothetical protein